METRCARGTITDGDKVYKGYHNRWGKGARGTISDWDKVRKGYYKCWVPSAQGIL